MEDTKWTLLPISKIEPNKGQIEGLPKNPRFIRDTRFDKLKKSIQDAPEMLQMRPMIVVEHGKKFIAICGNMRLRACLDLGHKELPCHILPAGTDPKKLREYTIKDNIGYGQNDWDILANEWDEVELEDWGIELEDWGLSDEPDVDAMVDEDNFTDEDAEKADAVCKLGDVWQLGNHRLMCGDSTDSDAVAKLMDGQKADICFTSPPYNIKAKFNGGGINVKDNKAYMDANGAYSGYADNLSDDEYCDMLCKALDNSLNHADDTFFNIGLTAGALKGTSTFLGANSRYFAGIICWKKTSAYVPGFDNQHGILRNIQEPIYCFNNRGTRKFLHPQWDKGYAIDNFFESKNAAGNEEKTHHATFPVELPAYFIEKFTKDSVLDLFGGSGTTLIAAEQLGRKCFMMELDPHYCDMIIARWEKLTGEKAKKIT